MLPAGWLTSRLQGKRVRLEGVTETGDSQRDLVIWSGNQRRANSFLTQTAWGGAGGGGSGRVKQLQLSFGTPVGIWEQGGGAQKSSETGEAQGGWVMSPKELHRTTTNKQKQSYPGYFFLANLAQGRSFSEFSWHSTEIRLFLVWSVLLEMDTFPWRQVSSVPSRLQT